MIVLYPYYYTSVSTASHSLLIHLLKLNVERKNGKLAKKINSFFSVLLRFLLIFNSYYKLLLYSPFLSNNNIKHSTCMNIAFSIQTIV